MVNVYDNNELENIWIEFGQLVRPVSAQKHIQRTIDLQTRGQEGMKRWVLVRVQAQILRALLKPLKQH